MARIIAINKRYLWGLLSLICLPLSVIASDDTLVVADFNRMDLDSFSVRIFAGETQYSLVNDEQSTVLKASANGTASALFRKMDIDLIRTPYLNWSWKVENVYAITDQKIKKGDDYPARIYVVVKQGIFPWQTKALNYVWSNKVESESSWANPFTARAVMIPLKFGEEGLGDWHREKVNIAEDFYRVFGERITRADGVAIMSDADNAGGSAVAFYADIHFTQD